MSQDQLEHELHTHTDPDALEDGTVWKFRLYITGDAPQSKLAIKNVGSLCEQHLGGNCQIDVIDLLREPKRYLLDDILVTPTLVRYTPEPVCILIGNLSNTQEVLMALGLKEWKDGS